MEKEGKDGDVALDIVVEDVHHRLPKHNGVHLSSLPLYGLSAGFWTDPQTFIKN